jgi:hypothetical protein
MFTRFADGDMPAFVDVTVKFVVAVANGAWCRLHMHFCCFSHCYLFDN